MTEYLTTKEISLLTGRSQNDVLAWHTKGKLVGEKLDGKRLFFDKEDVDEFIAQGRHIAGYREDQSSINMHKEEKAIEQRNKALQLGMFCVANGIKMADLHGIVWEKNEATRKKGLLDE